MVKCKAIYRTIWVSVSIDRYKSSSMLKVGPLLPRPPRPPPPPPPVPLRLALSSTERTLSKRSCISDFSIMLFVASRGRKEGKRAPGGDPNGVWAKGRKGGKRFGFCSTRRRRQQQQHLTTTTITQNARKRHRRALCSTMRNGHANTRTTELPVRLCTCLM